MAKQETKQVENVVMNKGPEYRTSDGFFRDPFTGAELTGKEPRCNDGLRTPRILASDGVTHIPIAYKFWTPEERKHFAENKAARSSGTGKAKVKNEELAKMCDKVLEVCQKSLKGAELKVVEDLVAVIRPKDQKINKVEKFVAGLDADQLEAIKALLK